MERGFIFYSSFVVKDMIIHFLTKVDGHMSRVMRDKCPVRLWIFLQSLVNADKGWNKKITEKYLHNQPKKGSRLLIKIK